MILSDKPLIFEVVLSQFNSATQAQLTTPGHGYNSDTTRQDGTTERARFSAAKR
jgi:hypothetical protein